MEAPMDYSNGLQDALREAIKHYSQNLRISQLELAHSARVSQPLISRFVSGTTNLSEDSMNRVQKALHSLVRDRVLAVGFFHASSSPLSSGDGVQGL
jgi:predicted transcriptional regulator